MKSIFGQKKNPCLNLSFSKVEEQMAILKKMVNKEEGLIVPGGMF